MLAGNNKELLLYLRYNNNIMCDQTLELIKTRNIFLGVNERSSEIVLSGSNDGDMYFTFIVKYVNTQSRTILTVIDDFHGDVTIETSPASITGLPHPLEVGTYQDYPLFLSYIMKPATNGLHEIVISFYIRK